MQALDKDDQYWAAKTDAREMVAKLESSRANWIDQSTSSGMFSGYVQAYWRNTVAYYSNLLGPQNWQSALEYAGVKGEHIKVKIPRARTFIRQFVTLTTRQRLAFEPLVDVDDAKPQMTAKIGRQLANHVVLTEGIDQKQEHAAELAATVGMSFYFTQWRTDRGSEYLPMDAQMLYTGAPSVTVHDIQDVEWDWTIRDWKQVIRAVVRQKQNRWDLIADVEKDQERTPEEKEAMKQRIRALPSAESEKRHWNNLNFVSGIINDDMVFVYTFIHKPTPALPRGRMTTFATRDLIFRDQMSNPYGSLPVEPVIFESMKDTSLGYPLLSSLLPAQEMFDHSFSVTATNQSAFGVQSLLNPRGSKISVEDLAGMKVINYTPQGADGGGKPEAMQWPATPPEIMNFASRLGEELSELAMSSATLRGQAPPNVTSGAMAATLSANSMEFLSGAQRANDTALENTMNHVMRAYQTFPSVDQIIEVTGEQALAYTKKVSKDALAGLRKVTLKRTSPMLNSQAGRIQLGESLMDRGLLKDPAMLVNLFNGAPPEVLWKGQWMENIAVQAELDALLEGRNVFPLETDNHPLYIAAYKELIDNPIIRERTDLPQIIMPLMKTRIGMEMQMDPTLKAFLRGQPLPEQAPPAQGGGGTSMAQGSKPLESGAAAPAQPAQPMPSQPM